MTKLTLNPAKLITATEKFEERKQAKIDAIKAYGESIVQGGFPHDFGNGVEHLQTRNDTDRTNWLTSQSAYQAQIAFGQGDDAGAVFRTAENNTITLTYQQGYMLILGMAAWGAHLYAVSWAKQDAVRACTNDTELDAVTVEDGWE